VDRPTLLSQPDAAVRLFADMASTRELAIDTEGASFHRFIDRIYLLQVSTRSHHAILDPLALDAGVLAPLGALLANPAIEKVFHDADYDLRLLQRDYGWTVRRIFDTRVAAQLLGFVSFGLAALLERYFGVKLDKKHQRADWSMRPLSDDMLRYAAQDTFHLLELRDRLHEELVAKGRLEWAREEFIRLEGTRWPDDDGGGAFLRMKGARDLTRRELAVLRELVPWRDDVARALDRATFRVIGNEQLLDIARTQPRTREELSRIRGISRGIHEERGNDILAAVRRGTQLAESELPMFPRAPRWDRDPRFDDRVNAVKTVRDRVAQDLQMDPGVLCARDRMEAVARRNPKRREDLLEMPELRRWQIEVLGEGFLSALATVKD
jgi:ribonuclease D